MIKPRQGLTENTVVAALSMTMFGGILLAAERPAEIEGHRAKLVIAALPFRDSSPKGGHGPLATAMGDMLVSHLASSPRLEFVDRSDLDKVLVEQKLALVGVTRGETQARIGRLLGAKYILTGGLTVLGKKIRVNAHLFEVETTRVVKSIKAEGKVDDVLDPVRGLAEQLSRDLDLNLPPIDPSSIDKSPLANLHFMRGLGYYYGNMRDHAIAEFMKALAVDPQHARARYWNGVCYLDLKEYKHARIEFDRFLKDFAGHALSKKVSALQRQCAASTRKSD